MAAGGARTRRTGRRHGSDVRAPVRAAWGPRQPRTQACARARPSYHLTKYRQRGFYPTRKDSTGWFKVLPAVPLSPAMPFNSRVSAGMKPPLGRDSSLNLLPALRRRCTVSVRAVDNCVFGVDGRAPDPDQPILRHGSCYRTCQDKVPPQHAQQSRPTTSHRPESVSFV